MIALLATARKFLKLPLRKAKESSFITRFRASFQKKARVRGKLLADLSDSLMKDPNKNIKLSKWDEEVDLREKADIHRARLSKYGRSKMNGEMLFMGPKGGIYKYNSRGKRKYI